ncbi:SDR family oxidoreductase [Agaribacter marinus]|uniref:SDR family oxidoreductase n=1 Tax=Virgibacillus salarius TaxID=447199 RepID=A0A941IB53_9BACI|nr:SDR family oxidoreductase [Virgibacillus salarius]MBR7796052.1 SDR family oxidoreductase [Virgibacillus salarius]NAZ08763.1 SDR family oxidoreductase [Agaribacter marinus]
MADRVVVITGAASGIGRATALKFAREGDKVVVADLNGSGQDIAKQITKDGGKATFIKTDVSKQEDVQNLVDKAVELYGSIDVMFNNAGIGDMGSILEPNIDSYHKTIGVNQHGVAYGIFAAGRKMKELNVNGVIINTASVFGYMANKGTFAYQASKGAVRMMTQTAALELAPFAIRVVGVAPGGVDTPIIQGYKDKGMLEHLKKQQMREQLIQPEAIANAVYLLSLKEADVINGSIVMLDDGYASFK